MKNDIFIWFVPAVLLTLLVCQTSGHRYSSVDTERYHDDIVEEVALEGGVDNGVGGEENALEVDADNSVAGKETIIQMPGVAPHKMDTYLCVAYKLPKDDRYIVKFEAWKAHKNIAHHMLLFGCEEPTQRKKTWNCLEMHPVCSLGKQTIVYAWAKDAPPLELPEDVGFHVGGDSGFKYLVLQVHYMHVDMFKGGKVDHSGVKFTLDQQKKRFLAGIYLLADGWAPILPHKEKTHIDMGCYYPKDEVNAGPKFKAFRFRVHAHKLGTVITGYRVRGKNWTLIGRGDPQKPQAFYKAFGDIDVLPGDTLMGRCTYNSMNRNTTTYIGATHSDEMCNFYIMYHYDSHAYPNVKELYCSQPAQHYFSEYSADSDVPLADKERMSNE